MSQSYKSELLSEEQSRQILKQFGRGPLPQAHRRVVLSDGFELKGSFDVSARNAKSGEIEWSHSQDNLVTDLGRLVFFANCWNPLYLGFMPSRETPSTGRYSVGSDGTQCVVSASQGIGTVTTATNTRSFGPVTFAAPSANRTLATLFVANISTAVDSAMGVWDIVAYINLSPSKVQTTLQTIELNYKISISPIV